MKNFIKVIFFTSLSISYSSYSKEPYCTWEKDIDVDRVKASTDTIYRGYGTKTKKAINRHLPFGLPDSDGDNEVLLAQKNYINWYDKDLRTSL
tara:strand:- start:798 stop:1076 length:279 start_codon:yes stop_codon:yes gene_type:complete